MDHGSPPERVTRYGSIWVGSYPSGRWKRSFAFDLVSDSLSLVGGVRKVKFRLLHITLQVGHKPLATNL